MQIDVFLITGFFHSGKTTWIKRILEKEQSIKKPILYIKCEDGDEKISEIESQKYEVKEIYIPEIEQYDSNELEQIRKSKECQSVVIEWNGFWPSSDVYRNLPDEWKIIEKIFVADATELITYNRNLSAMVEDKIAYASKAYINRITDSELEMECRKIIRKSSRRARIYFEDINHDICEDTEVIDTPYDLNETEIKISDPVFSYWLMDMKRRQQCYLNKIFDTKGQMRKDKDGDISFGRMVTTGRIQDAEFWSIPVEFEGQKEFEEDGWYLVQGEIKEKDHKLFLYIASCQETYEPHHTLAILP